MNEYSPFHGFEFKTIELIFADANVFRTGNKIVFSNNKSRCKTFTYGKTYIIEYCYYNIYPAIWNYLTNESLIKVRNDNNYAVWLKIGHFSDPKEFHNEKFNKEIDNILNEKS